MTIHDDSRQLLIDLTEHVGDPIACAQVIARHVETDHGVDVIAIALRDLFGVHLTTDPNRPGTYRA